jgi:nucleotide-binding universal stress UspA family protein
MRFLAVDPSIGVPIGTHVVKGVPSRVAPRMSHLSADLVVLGVHGHNVLDRLLFGSTAGHVVRGATCPVLTVRQQHEVSSTHPS